MFLSSHKHNKHSQRRELLELRHGRWKLGEQVVREHELREDRGEGVGQFVDRRVQIQVHECQLRHVCVVLEQEILGELHVRHAALGARLQDLAAASDGATMRQSDKRELYVHAGGVEGQLERVDLLEEVVADGRERGVQGLVAQQLTCMFAGGRGLVEQLHVALPGAKGHQQRERARGAARRGVEAARRGEAREWTRRERRERHGLRRVRVHARVAGQHARLVGLAVARALERECLCWDRAARLQRTGGDGHRHYYRHERSKCGRAHGYN